MGDIPPCATIYVNNLNEKIKKDELRKSLSAAFAQFGKVIDINCAKTYKLRGQAWVVFDTVTAATNAVKRMNDFPFYDKPMRVAYARTKSDATSKAEGTFDPNARDPLVRQKRKAESQALEKQSQGASKRANGDRKEGAGGLAEGAVGEAPTPPNAILFVQGLPEATTASMLSMLFQQFPGFVEVRMVEAKPGIAFVEFDSETRSAVALSGLQGFKINPTHSMTLSYAKK
mmetsp:Transcript_14850/g.62680  ORF Transcript_14850/g.62680 Transcript_14850/m.62680 type:complete len:230 (-) Transcript_14850:1101-1790(-)